MSMQTELADLLDEAGMDVPQLLDELKEALDLDELFETGSVRTEVAGRTVQFGLIVEIDPDSEED